MREGIDEGSARGSAHASSGHEPAADERGAARATGSDGEPQLLSVRGTRPHHGPEGAAPQDSSPEPVLVLTSTSGQVFHLPVDGSLRAAVRTASTPAPASAGAAVERLRPKDIQARIRGGESAAEVAESAGVGVDTVERYAGPVLAERSHLAALARATVVSTARSRPSLEDLVRHRLTSRGVTLAGVTWDAWRRGESGWVLQVGFRAGTRDRVAQWRFDPVAEHVEPLDDEARWLSSSHEAEATPRGRRLSSVRVFDVETDGGLDPDQAQDTGPLPPTASPGLPELPGDAGDGMGPHEGDEAPDHDEVAARTMDLLDALSDRRGRRQPMADLEMDEMDGLDDEDSLVDDITDAPGAPAGGGDDGGLGSGYASGFPAHAQGSSAGGRPGRSGSHLRAVFDTDPGDGQGPEEHEEQDGGTADGAPGWFPRTVDGGDGRWGSSTTDAGEGGTTGSSTPQPAAPPAAWWQPGGPDRSPARGGASAPDREDIDLTDDALADDGADRRDRDDGAVGAVGAGDGADDGTAHGADDRAGDGSPDAPAAPRTVGPSWAARGGVPETGSLGTWVGPSTPTALPDASSPLSLASGRVSGPGTAPSAGPAPSGGVPRTGETPSDGSGTDPGGDADEEPAADAGGAGRRKGGDPGASGRAGSARTRAGRRSSVPSWDEIVFGSASDPSGERED